MRFETNNQSFYENWFIIVFFNFYHNFEKQKIF